LYVKRLVQSNLKQPLPFSHRFSLRHYDPNILQAAPLC